MHRDPTFLQLVWFILIGILWAGYFVLEGFDFGVGMLVRACARDRGQTRMVIHTIGPVWDGNEVWLLVAGGATFAAFPGWYATTFSGFYIALFLVLAALIVRGVSFEFWGKVDSARWRGAWEWALTISSGLAALLFGVAWANFVHGVPMGADHEVHVTVFGLLNPYGLLGGVTTLSLFAAHGAGFIALRTSGDVQTRARGLSTRLQPVAAALLVAFAAWTIADQGAGSVSACGALVILAAAASVLAASRAAGAGFAASSLAIVALVLLLMVSLFPDALPSTTSPAFDLTLREAASTPYTLVVMTVVAAIFVPVVLAYQAWTYWVFRHRLGGDDYTGPVTPLAVVDEHRARREGGDGPSPAGAR